MFLLYRKLRMALIDPHRNTSTNADARLARVAVYVKTLHLLAALSIFLFSLFNLGTNCKIWWQQLSEKINKKQNESLHNKKIFSPQAKSDRLADPKNSRMSTRTHTGTHACTHTSMQTQRNLYRSRDFPCTYRQCHCLTLWKVFTVTQVSDLNT